MTKLLFKTHYRELAGESDFRLGWMMTGKNGTNRKPAAHPLLAPPVLVAVGGVVLSAAIFILAVLWERVEVEKAFRLAVADRFAAIEEGLMESLNEVNEMGAFFDAVGRVEFRQFRSFSSHAMAEVPNIQCLLWAPRVPAAQLAAFEEAAGREVKTGYRVRERVKRGDGGRGVRREEYFPVHFCAPDRGETSPLGFDLASDAGLFRVLGRARDTGDATVTETSSVIARRGDVLVAVRPVYRTASPPAMVEERRGELTGFVLATFPLKALFAKSFSVLQPKGVDLYAFDESSPGAGRRLVYFHPSRTRRTTAEPVAESELAKGLHESRRIAVADRKWLMLAVPAPAFMAANKTRYPWAVLSAGFLLTGMVTAYVRVLQDRAFQARRNALALSSANERMRNEIEERHKAQEKLFLAGRVIANSSEMIVVTDPQAVILDVNPAFTRLTGYSREEAIGRKTSILKSGQHDDDFYQKLWKTLLQSGQWQGEIRNRRKSGEIVPMLTVINAVKNDSGETSHYVSISTDISQLKEAEERLQYLAYFDALTGLPNRSLLREHLHQTLLEAGRKYALVALLLLDLDNFKDINDTFGHPAGDKILAQAAKLFAACMRQSDTVARMGGDEFSLVVKEIHRAEDAALVAQKIMKVLANPFPVEGTEVFLTASVGIAIYPLDGENMDELLQKADSALYHAKSMGRSRYQFFTKELNELAQQRISLQTDLRQALMREEFTVYYQPKVDLLTGRMSGIEGLLRWLHPERGVVLPGEFISLAEETGMIVPIGEKVLWIACTQNKRWQQQGFPPARVAINLSAVQFRKDALVQTILHILRKTGLDTCWLELEVTESAIMRDPDRAIDMLKALKEAGIRITMDDFGTGYSSLNYLRRFPVDSLKLDATFIRDVLTDHGDAEIVKAIIAMAHTLKMKVIAEGVETEDQLEFLRENGCDEVQGYYLARPMPAAEFRDLFQKGEWLGPEPA